MSSLTRSYLTRLGADYKAMIKNKPMNLTIKMIFIVVFSTFIATCAEYQASEDEDVKGSSSNSLQADDSMTRVGLIGVRELLTDYPKFKAYYDEYEPNITELEKFALLKDMDIVVFFGLWCHDSQREVSRLIKLIEQSGNQFNSVKLITLNIDKKVPDEYLAQFNVKYTPTIFLFKDSQILAEIIEKPKVTLAQDLLAQILH
jgi:thioredoxin 1